MKTIVRTCCQSSHSECGVLVHVEDGKVIRMEGDPAHPFTKGFICIKCRVQPQLVDHPDRLKYPLKRTGERGSGIWKRISWDEALEGIATGLTEIKESHGSESIASIHGTSPRSSLLSTTLLAHTLGSPNIISTDWHICAVPTILAETCTIGQSVMMEVGPDYDAANCIVVWGANPTVSHPPRGKDILRAKKRGAKLIVVDPRRTRLAKEADLWLQVRPGTDLILGLGMIHVLIAEGLIDADFVHQWCNGFEKLVEHVKPYTAERVAEITWVPADRVKEAARIYGTTKPAAFHHRVAVEQNLNSTQTNRTFAIMVALTGNIDIEGGNLLSRKPAGYITEPEICGWVGDRFRLSPEIEQKRIGGKEYPLIAGSAQTRTSKFVHPALGVEAMLKGTPYPIKGLYCAGGNPLNMQNAKRVWKALKNLKLLVVADFFMTPAAELADYVLPVAHWLERNECCDFKYLNCVSARQKVIEPLYECWDDLRIVIELVKKIPWANRRYLPWDNVDEFNDFRLKGTGIPFEELREKGYITGPLRYKKYESEGFLTSSGKVEITSTLFEKYGYDPLPTFQEPPESPVNTPQLTKNYPLILITGGRCIEYFHSEGRQIPRLRKVRPDPEIEIHPATAKQAGIGDGDWVWVETPRVKGERVRFRARLTHDIDPRVVHASHGWWFPEKPSPEHGCFESNINVVLSDDPPREPICGSVPTRGTLCRIYKDIGNGGGFGPLN